MKIVRVILVFIGIFSLIFVSILIAKFIPMLSEFDPQSIVVYEEIASKFIATSDLGAALIKSVPVQAGLTPKDVVESIKSLAVTHDLFFTGESPFHDHVKAVTGENYRYTNFLSFCDAQAGKLLANYRHSYAAFMPCRIALTEDMAGKLWLHSMNLSIIIHGGKEWPQEVKQEALKVWKNIQAIMDGAAKGEF